MNMLHIGIYGIVLQKRSVVLVRKKRGPYTGLLDLPGGRPLHGEQLITALKREIKEETGLTVRNADAFYNLTHTENYTEDTKAISLYHIGLLYMVEKFTGTLYTTINHEDVSGAEWYDLDLIKKKELSPFAAFAVQVIEKGSLVMME